MINRKIIFLPSPSSHYQPPPFFRLVSTASSSFLTSLQLLSHTILLSHLESSIITGTLLSWQRSYLTNRQQFVFVLPPQPLYLKVYPRVRCSAPFYSPFTCFPLVVSRPVLLSPTLLTSSSFCTSTATLMTSSSTSLPDPLLLKFILLLGTMSIKSPNPFSKCPVTECIKDNAVTWLYSHNNDDKSFIANILDCIVILIPIIILNIDLIFIAIIYTVSTSSFLMSVQVQLKSSLVCVPISDVWCSHDLSDTLVYSEDVLFFFSLVRSVSVGPHVHRCLV